MGVRRERAMEVAYKVKPAKSKYELTAEKMLKPEVAQHVAHAIVTSGMCYETAIPKALPETKAEDLGHTINIAKQSPVVLTSPVGFRARDHTKQFSPLGLRLRAAESARSGPGWLLH